MIINNLHNCLDRQKQAERRRAEESRADFYRERDKERKRKQMFGTFKVH